MGRVVTKDRRGSALLLAIGLVATIGLALEAAHRHVSQRQCEAIRRREWNAARSLSGAEFARHLRQLESIGSGEFESAVQIVSDSAGGPYVIHVIDAPLSACSDR